MNEDTYGLTDNAVPLDERLEAFNEALDDFGAKDPHLLSFDLKVTPQIVIAYYELNNLDNEELQLLRQRKIDVGLVSVLMNIDPSHRKEVYGRLDDFLRDEHPVRRIIEFLNGGAGLMTVQALYDRIKKGYWGAVSAYLKDMDIVSGTITKEFRRMLYSIGKWEAKKKQLDWLERAILHDDNEGLGVFTASTLEQKYPDSVEAIKQFLRENRVRYARTA